MTKIASKVAIIMNICQVQAGTSCLIESYSNLSMWYLLQTCNCSDALLWFPPLPLFDYAENQGKCLYPVLCRDCSPWASLGLGKKSIILHKRTLLLSIKTHFQRSLLRKNVINIWRCSVHGGCKQQLPTRRGQDCDMLV